MSENEQDSAELDATLKESDHSESSESSNESNNPNVKEADKEHVSPTRFEGNVNSSSGNVASIVGDNPQVTINYYIQTLNDAGRRSLYDDDEIAPQKRSVPASSSRNNEQLQEQYIENLKFERQNTTFFASAKAEKMQLTNDEQISQWYYALDEYEKCYVQTAAVIHGAPAYEISKRAENLYYIIYESAERQQDFLLPSSEQEKLPDTHQPPLRPINLSLQKKPVSELRANTHTLTRRSNGAERVFWKDVDEHGLSTFGLRLLIFLANEFSNHGQQGQHFLKNLDDWSVENNNECAWRSARAYGIVLWYRHTTQLYQIAKKWGEMGSIRRRRIAASLLDGAYEVEHSKLDDNESTTSSVRQLLEDWTNTQPSRSASNLRCTAANAYGLIGKKSPDIALAGLARLLKLPESQATDKGNDVFAAGVSAYTSLIWSGHIRKVLEHLAKIAEDLSHQRSLSNTVKARQTYRQQCVIQLNAVFETFFFVAAASYTEPDSNGLRSYTVTDRLPEQPVIPDPRKRDVLLTGLLVEEEIKWREHITILLCAAIVEKRSVSAFDLLHRWAFIVLKIQEQKNRIFGVNIWTIC